MSRPRISRAPGQLELAILALADVMKRFQRRGCRAQDDRDLLAVGAPDRQIARMVAPALLLFVRAVVLFIDHDYPEVFKRGK